MRDRLFEWLMALALLGIGLLIIISTGVLHHGALRFNLFGALPWPLFVIVVWSVGFARIIGLIYCSNGSWPVWGPRLRVLTSIFGAFFWFQALVGLIGTAFERGSPSIGIVVYGILAFGECVSCLMAAEAVRYTGKFAITSGLWRSRGSPS